ncbi:MAG TPA: PKD domain-containing protein, partial [Gemmatimonadaceae bacterium]|nr:PKD domain-containing protein [Gemmatimonadaceae bacterium]
LTVTDGSQQSNSAVTSVQVYYQPPTNQPPVAGFTFKCVVRADNVGADCSFDGTLTSDPDGWIASYVWSSPNRSSKTGLTISYPFPDGSTQTVTLVVTDNGGATNATSVTFVVR